MTHICVSKLTTIGSDNGLLPGRCWAIIWTNVAVLSSGSLKTNFSEILIEILTFSLKKMQLKMTPAKWRPFCLCLNMLIVKQWHSKFSDYPIDSSHKSHDAPMPYPTMHYFVTEMCTCAHFCNKMLHCGIVVKCIMGFMRCVYSTPHMGCWSIAWVVYTWYGPLILGCDIMSRFWLPNQNKQILHFSKPSPNFHFPSTLPPVR